MSELEDGTKLFHSSSNSFKHRVLESILEDYKKRLKKKLGKEERERLLMKQGIISRMLNKITVNENQNLKCGQDVTKDELNDISMALNIIKENIEVPKDLQIVVVKNSKMCASIYLGLSKKKMEKLLEKCREETTSFAYTIGRQDFVIFKLSKENIRVMKSLDAIIGLLAHEIMHVISRRKGEAKEIRASFKKEFINFFKEFVGKPNIGYKKRVEIAKLIGNAAVLSLKEIFGNGALIKKQLGDYLLAYYLILFEGKGEKKLVNKMSLSDTVDACLFSLYIMPVFLQFQYYKHSGSEKLIAQISKNYKTHLDFLYDNFDKTAAFVIANFDESREFKKNYFKQVFADTKSAMRKVKG